jgi:hypothetical protein
MKVEQRHCVQNHQLYRWREKYWRGADMPPLDPVHLTPNVLLETTGSFLQPGVSA